ncbi:hypothetical protein B0F90DRAFT_1813150 [Multifurca ochricompacta]|uniref:BZIP domain-containing protein n=1 Tax=Multifurca ochricompacta TaxID=376703 RepID=A0AAD4QTG5_9AGAM|nr:hypothetical protein B0F90DRAFT_1813150 [Multifurca ochricompacta]
MAPSTPKDDSSSRISDTALRKKKNADAQAAFRARRANYIATLEETVTNLEAVVLQLQDSCREARAEANELRQDNNRLRNAGREREKFWRALWQTKKGSESQVDEFPPPPACFGPMHPQITAINSQISTAVGPYAEDALHYPTGNTPPFSDVPYPTSTPSELATRSPSIPYAHGDTESHRSANQFTPYPSPPRNIIRDVSDVTWAPPIALTGSSGGDSGHAGSSSSSHSPTFVESPSVTTTDIPYLSRYSGHNFEDQKILPSTLDSAPYLPTSRSHSPTSTRPSSSSTSLTSPFQFPFNDASAPHEKGDFDYRRHHPPEVTLHGGIADVSLLSHGGDGIRLRLGARRSDSMADRPLFSPLPGSLKSDVVTGESGEAKSDMAHLKLRPRRTTTHGTRSPSPGAPPLSGTLAVIKAQAFGALRRTRSRAKKGADSAAKVALEALEARGIGMGVSTGSKRARIEYEDDDAD